MTYLYLIIDLVILAVLALFIWRGAVRGFILTLCSLVAVIVALLGASLLANLLSPRVSHMLEPSIQSKLDVYLTESIQDTEYIAVEGSEGAAAQQPNEVSLPGVLGVLQDMGLYKDLIRKVETAVRDGMRDAATSASHAVASALANSLAYAIVFLLAFILILILWTILSHALNLVARLPGLHGLNKFFGAVMGLLKGALLLFVVAWAIRLAGTRVIPEAALENTYLLRFFLTTNPIALLTGF